MPRRKVEEIKQAVREILTKDPKATTPDIRETTGATGAQVAGVRRQLARELEASPPPPPSVNGSSIQTLADQLCGVMRITGGSLPTLRKIVKMAEAGLEGEPK